jgi:hypothetical protein
MIEAGEGDCVSMGTRCGGSRRPGTSFLTSDAERTKEWLRQSCLGIGSASSIPVVGGGGGGQQQACNARLQQVGEGPVVSVVWGAVYLFDHRRFIGSFWGGQCWWVARLPSDCD